MVLDDPRPIYIDPYSILVHSKKGVVRRLYCPFTVKVIKSVGNYEVGQLLSVEMVKSDPDGWLIYFIDGEAYWYGRFCVVVQ